MNRTPVKKSSSGKIRHLLRVTAASLQFLPFAGLSLAQAAAKNVYAGFIGNVTRKKGFRCGALVLLFTCGVLFAMGGAGLAQVNPCDSGNTELSDIFVLSGSATFVFSGSVPIEVQLTSNSRDQAGAAMSKGKIDFREPFTIAFQAHFGYKDWNGADGMAMVFHNDPKGSAALGRPGSALGAGGIRNGIALEFDTFHGTFENWGSDWWKYDWREDHTSIWDTDQMGGYLGREPQSYLTTFIGHGNLEDRAWHDVEIRWNPETQTLSYTLDGANAGSYTHSGTTDFVSEYFGGATMVHFGISAAVGGYTNIQRIRFDDFCSLPFLPDTDRDGIDDIDDIDDDNDGITDCVENGLDNAEVADVFVFSGSARRVGPRQALLTPDSPGNTGAAMSKGKIDFREPFTIAFEAYFGTRDWTGADGMAVVFHNDPKGSAATGLSGSALGAGGIQNGIALEFDTYHGSSENWGDGNDRRQYGGWREDHTSIWDTDQMGGYLGRDPQSYLTTAIAHGNIEDGAWHDVVISWDPATGTLAYTLDGAGAGSYTHRWTTDFVTAYFGGANRVHFGITAATGGYTNVQKIRFDDFCSLPLGLDTDGDGVPNHLDLDSDADGISDLEESGADHAALDTNSDGEIDSTFPDTDGDGLSQFIELANGENTGTTPRNTDDDGAPDYHDRDSDGDDCPDAIEGDRSPSFYFGDTDSDGSLDQSVYPADDRGRHDGTTNQGDGSAADSSVNACTACDPATSGNNDFDGDTVSDICDLDDDNDGITDCVDNGLDNPEVTDVFGFSGSALPIDNGSTQALLTPDSPDQAGAAMFKGKVDFREPFTIAFQARFGTKDKSGGNGIAMVFHNDPRGSAALGRPGFDLGAAGIKNGVALAIGTRVNYGEIREEDFTSIWATDTFRGEGPNVYLSRPIGHPSVEDGRWHDVAVTWDPATETLAFTLDGANAGSYTVYGWDYRWHDFITRHFGGASLVHFGMTAATGDAANVQSIRFDDFDFCSQPLQLDTNGDGRPNHQDLDSDGDGAWDLEESGADYATLDVNNDGEIDAAFPDTDGDGLSQEIEAANGKNTGTTPRDANDDGIADFLDPDS